MISTYAEQYFPIVLTKIHEVCSYGFGGDRLSLAILCDVGIGYSLIAVVSDIRMLFFGSVYCTRPKDLCEVLPKGEHRVIYQIYIILNTHP